MKYLEKFLPPEMNMSAAVGHREQPCHSISPVSVMLIRLGLCYPIPCGATPPCTVCGSICKIETQPHCVMSTSRNLYSGIAPICLCLIISLADEFSCILLITSCRFSVMNPACLTALIWLCTNTDLTFCPCLQLLILDLMRTTGYQSRSIFTMSPTAL